MSHAGLQILLNVLREEFWITRGRRTIRNALKYDAAALSLAGK